jgi:Kef-type K+ transport system membrane component KefB
MLLEEFNYAGITAYQAMEDRARISSFYYILVGVLASGLAAIYQLSGGTHNVPLFLVVTLLIVGGIISICFFVTLIRLRQAYKESLISMNVIKEFYIEEFKQQIPAIEHAFRWRLETIPKGERVGSVTFMIASLNAIIGSLCLAGAVFIGTEQPLSDTGAIILAVVVFMIAMLVHIFYYRKALSKQSDAEVIRKQEEDVESAIEKNPG